jgi:hypothetical protein
MPGNPCCKDRYPCTNDCDSGVPDELTVTIGGAVDDDCSNWANLNGSYVIDYQTCTRWSATFGTPILEMSVFTWGCLTYYWSDYFLNITVRFDGSFLVGDINVHGIVNIGGAKFSVSEGHQFKSVVSLPDDCCSWSSQSLTYDGRFSSSGLFGGDLSTATFSFTAGSGGC